MKKIFALLLSLTMALSLCACGGASNGAAAPDGDTSNPTADATDTADTSAPAEDTADTSAAGARTFTVGFDAEFPPYGFSDGEGGYTGLDLDLAQAVCDIYGWELVKQPIDWDSKDMELDSGAIDCIWNGFTMTGREDQYTWTEPYIDNSQVIVVKADSGITTLADLAGKALEVQADSSALAALEGEEATEQGQQVSASVSATTQVGDYNTAFMDLDAGVCDAVALDVGVANYQLANRENDYVILDEEISTEQYGVGFKLGNEELRDQVQDALYSMVSDGTVDQILEKWSSMDNGAYSYLADTWCLEAAE